MKGILLTDILGIIRVKNFVVDHECVLYDF